MYQTLAWFSWASYSITGCCWGTSLGLDCCLFPQADWSPISDHSSEKFKFQHPKTRSEITALVFPSMDREGWCDFFCSYKLEVSSSPTPSHPARGFHVSPHLQHLLHSIYSQRSVFSITLGRRTGVVSGSSPSASLVPACSRRSMHVCWLNVWMVYFISLEFCQLLDPLPRKTKYGGLPYQGLQVSVPWGYMLKLPGPLIQLVWGFFKVSRVILCAA